MGSRGVKIKVWTESPVVCRVHFSVPDPRLGFCGAIFSAVTYAYLFRIIQHYIRMAARRLYLPYERTARPTLEAPAAPTPAVAA